MDDLMKEVLTVFDKSQTVYFASSENGQPRVRPMSMQCLENRFWLLTGSEDDKISQLSKNGKMEFCYTWSTEKGTGIIRAAGMGMIVSDIETRIRIAGQCDFFDQYWQDKNDSGYALVKLLIKEISYIKPGEFETHKISF